MQSEIPAFLINMHRVSSTEDANAYISRINGINSLIDQLIENLKEREVAGIIAPIFVFDHVLFDSRNIISGYPFKGNDSSAVFNDFFSKVQQLQIPRSKKEELLLKAKTALLESMLPGYQKLITAVENLRSGHNEKDGVWRWKNGGRFYQNALNRTTTTSMTADEIHELGLREVRRIHFEMDQIKDAVGFKGSLQEFFTEMKENNKFYYPNTSSGKDEYIKELEYWYELFVDYKNFTSKDMYERDMKIQRLNVEIKELKLQINKWQKNQKE
jgi:uncharacterized protein (DUF885 family)